MQETTIESFVSRPAATRSTFAPLTMASFTGKEEQVESEQAFDILPIIGQRRNQLKVLPQSLGIGARDQTLRKSFGPSATIRRCVTSLTVSNRVIPATSSLRQRSRNFGSRPIAR